MTQDAVPGDGAIRELLKPLAQGVAAAAFARQVARTDASPLERFARLHNYPAQGRLISGSLETEQGVVFSNACSAVHRQTFEELGRFPTHTIMNEDMVFAARLLKAGHTIAYVADAVVTHSHEYGLRQTFKRYFDIGVVLSQAEHEIGDLSLSRQGVKYVVSLLSWLWQQGYYTSLHTAFIESAAKWLASSIGMRYDHLPRRWRARLSMHPSYWNA